MRYEIHVPSPELSDYVQCYWALCGPRALDAEPERILPDGCIELIFNFGDPFEEVSEGGIAAIQPRALLVGQLTRFMTARPTGRVDLLAIRFRPNGAVRFLDPPIDALVNRTFSAAELDRFWIHCLEMLGGVPPSKRLQRLEHALLRHRELVPCSPELAHVVRCMKRRYGIIRVRDLADEVNLSMSALQRTFKRHVGISPKSLSRIFRIQRALDLGDMAPRLTVSQIAHRCGYFDHAHFTRDFSAITGQPPSAYLRSVHDFSDMFREGRD